MQKVIFIIFLIVFSFFAPIYIYANGLNISNVSLQDRSPGNGTVVVEFDLSWDNSWHTKINHDAVWITVRLYDPASSPTYKKLCKLSASGINPEGTSVGTNSNLEIYVPEDKVGAFVRPASYGKFSSVSSEGVRLTIDYTSAGFDSMDDVKVSVFGIEMVYVPEGAFYAGDYDASTASLDQGGGDSDPWYISSEGLINVSNPSADGYRYVSAGNTGEDATGSSFTISSSFPKGYASFYVMKYEVNEGQWVEFINSLPSDEARANHDLTDASHKNTDMVRYRNTISCSGSPLYCSTQRPARALNYLSWKDLAAFLDWAGLRPMTELEYEKASRGPLLSVAGEFAWGTVNIVEATAISSGEELGAETIVTPGANANYNSVVFTGGDAVNGAEYAQGALRGGIFATADSNRETAGAGYYGVMELSGNLAERIVTIGNSSGRSFSGSHGDGYLSTAPGYEGNATNTDWPGINDMPSYGVTGAAGTGFKGGAWSDRNAGAKLRVSDRSDAAKASEAASNNAGGRGVRSCCE